MWDVGAFDDGEVRNGGLPDWLYGKPFEVRSLDEGFLLCVKRLYHELGVPLKGLCFKDGGPIIGTQLDNEYMHSAAPWEMTTGVANEWMPGGEDGVEYLHALKKLAQEEGILTPFYTSTGWGGAAMDASEMMPLWGSYAFWPWIFYDYRGEHLRQLRSIFIVIIIIMKFQKHIILNRSMNRKVCRMPAVKWAEECLVIIIIAFSWEV